MSGKNGVDRRDESEMPDFEELLQSDDFDDFWGASSNEKLDLESELIDLAANMLHDKNISASSSIEALTTATTEMRDI